MRDIRRFYVNGKNPYKSPTKLIDSHHPDIKAAAEYLVRTEGLHSAKIEIILDFVQHEIDFVFSNRCFDEPASKILFKKGGNFLQRISLACAMLRSIDIGCRMHFYEARHPLYERLKITPPIAIMGYLEIYDEGDWVSTDRFLLPENLSADLLQKPLSTKVYDGSTNLIWSHSGNHQVRDFGIRADASEIKSSLSPNVIAANQPGWWERRARNLAYKKLISQLGASKS
jgi:hypothetical protein